MFASLFAATTAVSALRIGLSSMKGQESERPEYLDTFQHQGEGDIQGKSFYMDAEDLRNTAMNLGNSIKKLDNTEKDLNHEQGVIEVKDALLEDLSLISPSIKKATVTVDKNSELKGLEVITEDPEHGKGIYKYESKKKGFMKREEKVEISSYEYNNNTGKGVYRKGIYDKDTEYANSTPSPVSYAEFSNDYSIKNKKHYIPLIENSEIAKELKQKLKEIEMSSQSSPSVESTVINNRKDEEKEIESLFSSIKESAGKIDKKGKKYDEKTGNFIEDILKDFTYEHDAKRLKIGDNGSIVCYRRDYHGTHNFSAYKEKIDSSDGHITSVFFQRKSYSDAVGSYSKIITIYVDKSSGEIKSVEYYDPNDFEASSIWNDPGMKLHRKMQEKAEMAYENADPEGCMDEISNTHVSNRY